MNTKRDLDQLVWEVQGRTPLRASALLFTILIVISVTFIWAWLTEIDDVTRAPGRVVPAGDVQRVQATEAGVISAVFVKEGDIVTAGEPLVELDALTQTSQLDREVKRVMILQTRIARLSAEINGRVPVFPSEIEATTPALVDSERALHI
ncbi:MAG: biotin/lipoyl-binding protein, partial [Sulfitobacter sp.]|nr:biotin/lipoyl-binding protein [Sulfitobacter sp.]